VCALVLVLVTTFALSLPYQSQYDLVVGDVAPQDIRAPRKASFVSNILSERALAEAIRNVPPVYTRSDPEIARLQRARSRQILDFINAIRADPYATTAQKQAWILAVAEMRALSMTVVNTILTLPEANWNQVQLEVMQLLDELLRQEDLREDSLPALRERLPSLVPMDYAQDEAAVVAGLVSGLLVPNSFYDEAATEAARQQAAEATAPVFQNFQAGEIIVREGSLITDLHLETLDELGLAREQRDWREWTVVFSAALLGTLLLGVYLLRMQPAVLDHARQEYLLLLLLALFAALARLLIPDSTLLPYLFPGAAMGMLIATTIGYPAAVGSAVFLGLLSGWMAGFSLSITVLVMLSCLVAILSLPNNEDTTAIFRSGILSGLISAVMVLALSPADDPFQSLSFLLEIAVSLTGGIISGGLTLGALFILAPLFDLTTTFRLLEMSRPNHPLLQRLLREAPATFHHTMMVASMAEQAAERIGANTLLTRVGAYYHDVGKLTRPYFFVENQEGLSNPHDRLDPHTSVEIVIGHVRDGLKLASEYGLPADIRAFIPEHQGTMRVSFFYQKALKLVDNEAGLLDEAQFRYPGPRPQSRETALVMLADGCEATARARRPKNGEEIEAAVQYIFDQRIQDGQLDACPLTLAELQLVRETYIEILRGAFHPRIQYPGATPKRNHDEDKTSN